MRENTIKALIAVSASALGAYFHVIFIPLIVLFAAVCVDYITGLVKAWMTAQLSSKTGFRGIIKKVSYFVIVAVGMGADWLIQYGLSAVGITYKFGFTVALIVIVWLVINEMISILENLAIIGAPVPQFLIKLINRLKNSVDEQTKDDEDKED